MRLPAAPSDDWMVELFSDDVALDGTVAATEELIDGGWLTARILPIAEIEAGPPVLYFSQKTVNIR